MRFLVDQALSPLLADLLSQAGHDAVHVRTYGMQASSDAQIITRAGLEDRILVSADTDFGTLLALWRARKPSVVLFRSITAPRPEQQVNLLLSNLSAVQQPLEQGC